MTGRPPLPDFDKPPITEVALSIQFEELAKFRSIHLGLLWEELGIHRFPDFEEQPPVHVALESLDGSESEAPKFEVLDVPPMPRYLFISVSGNEVVQIQQDRFTVNWRKRKPTDEYPRFEHLAAFFDEQCRRFEGFLSRRNLGRLEVNQAELTYVNRIEKAGQPSRLRDFLSVLSGAYSDDFLQDPEEVYASFRYPLYSSQERVGRLYIDVRPEAPGNAEGALKMVLRARGKPAASDRVSAEAFFTLARQQIVSGFASITSKEAHNTWGRRDNA